ncbi:hypothetical protein DEU56DRAFT_214579 [Suillus clintonianus]|uniref:uncharacterized protein n=1 Tax=Suillus clintonianus TaxID=1904413 RepID=UPI001B879366|nr:uncharacterized protein DEU56DRAFT_214579 [Suillus clintonianus]KAG2111430.1 hypothetical protein DEU56DRAFT_214579 [Suillus clintonianus]
MHAIALFAPKWCILGVFCHMAHVVCLARRKKCEAYRGSDFALLATISGISVELRAKLYTMRHARAKAAVRLMRVTSDVDRLEACSWVSQSFFVVFQAQVLMCDGSDRRRKTVTGSFAITESSECHGHHDRRTQLLQRGIQI